MRSAIVLFSGGQDSATCLAWALDRYDQVETIGFDYGQRHKIELECRHNFIKELRAKFPAWSEKLGHDHSLNLNVLGEISETALTTNKCIEFTESGLPNTFVPGRNLLFFTLAAAIAFRRGLKTIVGGMCETDYSGYPDCRDDTIKALQVTLNLGLETNFVIETPLMWIDKSQTWELAEKIGGETLVALIQKQTHTCYEGNHDKWHDWGYGCGKCPACELRLVGYKAYAKNRGNNE